MRSNTGRLPSAALAVVITVAMLSLVVATSGRLSTSVWRGAVTRPTTERVTFIARPAPVPIATRPPQAAPSATATQSGGAASSAVGAGATSVIAPAPGGARDTGSTAARSAAPAIPLGSAGVVHVEPTFTQTPGRTTTATVSVPLTGAQMDSVLASRIGGLFGDPKVIAEAKRMAADAKGRANDEQQRELGRAMHGSAPYYHGLGVSIPAFGGPSAGERRKADSVDALVRARLQSIDARAKLVAKARADSVRRRDSLRLASDTNRTPPTRRDSLE